MNKAKASPEEEKGANQGDWTFLTNHAHALICIAADPGIRVRDIAERVGITERATQRIVADLEREGYLSKKRVGRRNHYQIHTEIPLRHEIERHHQIGVLLDVLASAPDAKPSKGRARKTK